MKISLKIQYNGEKALALNQLKDSGYGTTEDYLERIPFLLEDLEHLNLPEPQGVVPIWASAFVFCNWHDFRNGDLQARLWDRFKFITKHMSLEARSIKYLALHSGTKSMSTLYGVVKESKPPYVPLMNRIRMDPRRTPAAGIYKATRFAAPSAPAKRESTSPALPSLQHRIYPPSTPSMSHTRSSDESRPTEHVVPSGTGPSNAEKSSMASMTLQTVQQLSQSAAVRTLLETSKVENTISSLPQAPFPTPSTPPLLLPKATSSSAPARPSSVPMSPAPSTSSSTSSVRPRPINSTEHAVTRDLWDVRRQLTALQAREASLVLKLRQLGVSPGPAEPIIPSRDLSNDQKSLEQEVTALRALLQQESSARHAAESALQEERQRRKLSEGFLDDARRESTAPFVVPALIDAFKHLSQLTADALMEVDLEYTSKSSSGW